jgi:hypothetical protein
MTHRNEACRWIVSWSVAKWSAHSYYDYTRVCHRSMNEQGSQREWYWQEKVERPGEKCASMLSYPPQIPRELDWIWARSFTANNRLKHSTTLNELQWMGREEDMAHHSSGGHTDNHERKRLGCRSRGRHSNVGPPTYEAELPPSSPRCSVTLLIIRIIEWTSRVSSVSAE